MRNIGCNNKKALADANKQTELVERVWCRSQNQWEDWGYQVQKSRVKESPANNNLPPKSCCGRTAGCYNWTLTI